jgi:hypothetical protein
MKANGLRKRRREIFAAIFMLKFLALVAVVSLVQTRPPEVGMVQLGCDFDRPLQYGTCYALAIDPESSFKATQFPDKM